MPKKIYYLRILFYFLFTCFSAINLYSQDFLVDKFVNVKKLNSELKSQEALTQLQLIENDCVSSDNDTIIAVFFALKGLVLMNLERYEECIPLCKKSIQLFEQCNLRQSDYLESFSIIAISYHRLKDYKNAEKYYRKGLLKSVTANVNSINQYRALLYLNLGKIYEMQGDSILSNECINIAEQLKETNLLDVHEWNYYEWENSCWEKINMLIDSAKYFEAVDAYSVFIQNIKEKKGIGVRYIKALYGKAILLSRYLINYEEALPIFEDVVKCGNLISLADESVCGAYCSIALSYSYLGDFNKLNTIVDSVKAFLTKANNDKYPPHSIYRFVGNGAYWTQKYDIAIHYYEIYLSPKNKREGGYNYDEITNQLSVSYILANKPKNAEILLTNYLKTDEERLKKENLSILSNIYHNLGRAYMIDNSIKEALKYLNYSKELQIQTRGEVTDKTQQYINECMLK